MNDRLSDYADKGEVMKVVAICLVILPLCACWTTGNGEKVGTIIKVADEGMFSTTHEFEIVRGGMAGGAGSFSITPACITVEEGNPQLEAIRDAFNKQIEVVVNYRQELFAPFRSEGDCGMIFNNKFLTSIRAAR